MHAMCIEHRESNAWMRSEWERKREGERTKRNDSCHFTSRTVPSLRRFFLSCRFAFRLHKGWVNIYWKLIKTHKTINENCIHKTNRSFAKLSIFIFLCFGLCVLDFRCLVFVCRWQTKSHKNGLWIRLKKRSSSVLVRFLPACRWKAARAHSTDQKEQNNLWRTRRRYQSIADARLGCTTRRSLRLVGCRLHFEFHVFTERDVENDASCLCTNTFERNEKKKRKRRTYRGRRRKSDYSKSINQRVVVGMGQIERLNEAAIVLFVYSSQKWKYEFNEWKWNKKNAFLGRKWNYLLLNAVANGGGSIGTAGASSKTNIIAVSYASSIIGIATATVAVATAAAAAACIQQLLFDVG